MILKYEVLRSTSFKKEYKLLKKQNKNMKLIDDVVEILASGQKLSPKYKDHALKGNFIGYRECHIQPDWLLIYRIENDKLCLVLSRTGSHSDLF